MQCNDIFLIMFLSFLPSHALLSFVGTTILFQGAMGNEGSPCTLVNSVQGGGAASAADGCGIMETSKLITLTNDFLRK